MNTDWFDELSSEQQIDILEGIEEADRGEVIEHEEVVKIFYHLGLR